jgi:predicted PurR-regulated permease PerM
MLTQFASITRATVKGTLVIGIIQGTLAGIAFWVAGIEGAALWGTIMTILSIIPGIGAALVVGAGSYHFICNGAVSNGNLAGRVVRRCGRHCR